MHVAVIPVVLFCTAINPAVDKIAGAFPKLLPLQIVTTISDITCVVVLHVPTLTSILGILSDLGTVVSDLPPRGSFPVTRRSPRIGMKR
jgi:hypothetical protein